LGGQVVRRGKRLSLACVVAVLAALACSVTGAFAAPITYTVSSTTDGTPGSCAGGVCPTLRDAMTAANANPGSTIQLAAGSYQLSSTAGALEITANVTIDGLGPSQTTIDQTHAGDRVVTISGGTVAISGVTITGGTLQGAAGKSGSTTRAGEAEGGAIDNAGTLTLADVAVSGNTATGGTGATNNGGGDGEGGGVYNTSALTLIDSTISHDSALPGAIGGGGYSGGGYGGGIYSRGSGTLTVTDSTIGPDDMGSDNGGGIDLEESPTATIINTTIFGNATSEVGTGGGIAMQQDTHATLASDTIDANTAGYGGNIYVEVGKTVEISDTIIANGTGNSGPENCRIDSPSDFVDGGHNLESDAMSQCGLASGKSDLLVSNPSLASALGANGGATATVALLAGAAEIGAGGTCPTAAGLDQRGLPRPGVCDIGAFQTQPVANTALPAISGTAQVGQTLSCTAGTWTGDGPLSSGGVVEALSFSYRWLRGGVAIAGATSSSYRLQAADASQQLSCTVTATGAYGQANAGSAIVGVAAALSPAIGVSGAPQLSAVSQSASRWLEGSSLASISRAAKLPVGTTFRFTLSQAATVTLVFTQLAGGRAVGGRCVVRTKRNADRQRCERTVTVATMSFDGPAGANAVRFAGRISRQKKLKPGRYTVVIAASISGERSTSHSLSFAIVAPKR
jgi:hypothetical protein